MKNTVSSSKTHTILSDISDGPKIKGVSSEEVLLQSFAEIMNVQSVKNLNPDLYRFLNTWMGVKHKDGGTDKNGIDCSGFIGILFKEVYKINLPRSSGQMGEIVKRNFEKDLKEGDLVFFSFGNRQIDHVGVYLQNGVFAHVSTSKGVILSKLRDPWYYKYYVRSGPVL